MALPDDHNLGLTAAITVVMQLVFFLVAYTLQFDKVTDFAGSTNFIVIALVALVSSGHYTPRGVAAVSLLIISRAELAGFLLYRVIRRGHDARFDEVRGNFVAFLVFWIFQMVWAWGVSLAVVFAASEPAVGAGAGPAAGLVAFGSDPRDVAGVVLFAAGFLIQVAADFQKDAFRADPANRGKVCAVGVWRNSRHPNFFGEILLWWGIFVLCSPTFDGAAAGAGAGAGGGAGGSGGGSGSSWGYVCVLSPLLTMLILLKGSGMPTAEGDYQKRFMRTRASRDAFVEYRRVTSPLVPLPRALYGALPLAVKRWALFEWPSYETDWAYCGEDSADRAAGAKAGGSGAAGATNKAGETRTAGAASPVAAAKAAGTGGGGGGPGGSELSEPLSPA